MGRSVRGFFNGSSPIIRSIFGYVCCFCRETLGFRPPYVAAFLRFSAAFLAAGFAFWGIIYEVGMLVYAYANRPFPLKLSIVHREGGGDCFLDFNP